MIPTRTNVVMAAAEMPLWERVLLHLAFTAAVTVCFVWTLLVVVVLWPFAAAWWLLRGENEHA